MTVTGRAALAEERAALTEERAALTEERAALAEARAALAEARGLRVLVCARILVRRRILVHAGGSFSAPADPCAQKVAKDEGMCGPAPERAIPGVLRRRSPHLMSRTMTIRAFRRR